MSGISPFHTRFEQVKFTMSWCVTSRISVLGLALVWKLYICLCQFRLARIFQYGQGAWHKKSSS
jgi:hypothetical protein